MNVLDFHPSGCGDNLRFKLEHYNGQKIQNGAFGLSSSVVRGSAGMQCGR